MISAGTSISINPHPLGPCQKSPWLPRSQADGVAVVVIELTSQDSQTAPATAA